MATTWLLAQSTPAGGTAAAFSAEASAWWGAVGGAVTVLLILLELLGRNDNKIDFSKITLGLVAGNVLSASIRVMLGALAAWLLAASQQLSGPLGAVAVGMGAPEILRRLAETVRAQGFGSQTKPGG